MKHNKLDEKWIIKHEVNKGGLLDVWIEEERTGRMICDFEFSANSKDCDELNAAHIVEIHNESIKAES